MSPPGAATINGRPFAAGDAAIVEDEGIEIRGGAGEVLLFDLR